MEYLGIFGVACLFGSNIPQLIKIVKDGHATGLSAGFLWLWFVGLLSMLVFVWPSANKPLIANYALSFVMVIIMLVYKHFPRRRI